jgi:hypothetical protein
MNPLTVYLILRFGASLIFSLIFTVNMLYQVTLVEGSWPVFGTVALAQGIWGLGYTFTSGATEAWVADELGEAHAGQAFLLGSQAGTVGGLVAIPLSVAIGTFDGATAMTQEAG